MLNIPILLDRLCYRQPSLLVDAITEHDAGRRLVAVKNVTVNEEFFQGHFPGAPVLPGVTMLESLSQVAALLLLHREDAPANARVYLRGINDAKFRRQVLPGDQLRLEVTLGRRRTSLARAQAAAIVGDQVVAEAELLLGLVADETRFTRVGDCSSGRRDRPRHDHRAAREHRSERPHRPGLPHRRVGRGGRLDGGRRRHRNLPVRIDRPGAAGSQYQGEATRLVIGRRNIFREFVTINRGTRGGGGVTTIGNRNVFMAYVHVAHDSTVGDDTIFGPHATLGGHVAVESYANISAGSAVHQFCRVGQHGFIGGYSVITKDALPFARTVGSRPARIFGANTVGLTRRGFTPEVIAKLKRSFRYLLQSKLNTTRALRANRAGSVAVVSRGAVT